MNAITSLITPAASPSPSPAQAGSPSPRPNEFAKLLNRTQAQAQAAPQPSQDAEPEASRSPEGTAKPAAPTRERNTPRADKPRQPQTADKPAATSASQAKDADKTEETTADEASDGPQALDPALADWLQALNWPHPPAAQAAAGGGKAAAGDADAAQTALLQDATGGQTTGLGGAGRDAAHHTDAAKDLAGREARASGAEQALAGRDSAVAWQAAKEQVIESFKLPSATPARAEGVAGAAGAGGLSSLAAAATPSATQAHEATTVAMNTPVQSPEFPQALGVQISTLARDGVQQAELHLNPADMGPISVQIALDGTQAQVDFGADLAATRQIIESGLPELAAALSDAGFTLTGGGVHQQARDSQDGGASARGGSGGERSGSALEAADAAPRRVTTRVSAGGVDLYA